MPKLIDLHCDTLSKMYHFKDTDMMQNDYNVDITKLKKADSYLQCFALFNHVPKKEGMYQRMMDFYDFYIETINMHDDLSVVKHFDDIEHNRKAGKLSVLFSIEDTGPVEGDMDRLIDMYNNGARMMGFTWNYDNCFGFANSDDDNKMELGLNDFGRDAIVVMNELGIVIDISHLNDGGAYEVLNRSEQPIMATHSNARAITDVSRNLTDDLIKRLGDNGGVMGLNFYSSFLGDSDDNSSSTVENMLLHAKHIIDVGGSDILAIGTDFDGIPSEGIEISDIGCMDKLYSGLKKSGFSDDIIDKIYYKNALRVFSDALK